jgi:hypothetical protein
MSDEIKPRIVDGEPVCAFECPQCNFCGASTRCDLLSADDYLPCCVPALRQQRDDARKERDKLWHALQSFTPQGSDDGEPLCGTPEECVTYVRELKRRLEKFRRMQDSGMVLDI